jgi:Acyl-CoA dehydrogenase, C-terminal domain
MDRSEQELFENTLRHAIEARNADSIDGVLDELGWPEALAADRRAAIGTVLTLQGACNVISSALDDVLAQVLGVGGPTAVILPQLGRSTPPASRTHDGLSVRGIGTCALRRCSRALLVTEASGGQTVLEAEVAGLTFRPVAGLDPGLGWVEVLGCGPSSAGEGLRADATHATDVPAAWEEAVAVGRLAVAHELVGAGRAMLTLARDHALDRVQFGRPVAGFQAVRHRLAEAFVALEQADAALAAAWEIPTTTPATVAKALAGRAASTVARHAQQVLAGIGFTTDHPFHRYLRRVVVLDQLLGSGRDLTIQLGREAIAARRLPALPSL